MKSIASLAAVAICLAAHTSDAAPVTRNQSTIAKSYQEANDAAQYNGGAYGQEWNEGAGVSAPAGDDEEFEQDDFVAPTTRKYQRDVEDDSSQAPATRNGGRNLEKPNFETEDDRKSTNARGSSQPPADDEDEEKFDDGDEEFNGDDEEDAMDVEEDQPAVNAQKPKSTEDHKRKSIETSEEPAVPSKKPKTAPVESASNKPKTETVKPKTEAKNSEVKHTETKNTVPNQQADEADEEDFIPEPTFTRPSTPTVAKPVDKPKPVAKPAAKPETPIEPETETKNEQQPINDHIAQPAHHKKSFTEYLKERCAGLKKSADQLFGAFRTNRVALLKACDESA
jgi:hypothetical protein